MRAIIDKNIQPTKLSRLSWWKICLLSFAFIFATASVFINTFEMRYRDKTYPNVSIGGISFGGQTKREVEEYWLNKNIPFQNKQFEFRFQDTIATASAASLGIGYDATLSATQAYEIGRSKHFLSNVYQKYFQKEINLTPYFQWDQHTLDLTIEGVSQKIDIPVQDALFRFHQGRVTAFRPSRIGRQVNKTVTNSYFVQILPTISDPDTDIIRINLPVEIVLPSFTTEQVNSFGIKELIGKGYSEFKGSIPGRIHNVLLAAAKLNGVLIKPGETFSFNDTVGDISAATGYQSAYVIKNGRTVLGDGGGVCQVSTTLFRAALSAGLPIVERQAHAYRVHYYEEAGEKPGLDATVFAPSVDFRFKNNTPAYILIQTKTDTQKLSLTFELYGINDGRVAEIFNHQVGSITPPPPPLYQDDPTLPPGVTRQVDFAAWGTKTSFQYRVRRGAEILEDTKFVSNFRPWQAVYLRNPQ